MALTDQERQARYRAKHRDKINARNRQWRADNPERAKEVWRKSRAKHPCTWAERNPEKHRARSLRWSRANKEKHIGYTLRWAKNNPAKARAISALRRARIAKAPGLCSDEQLEARLAFYGYRCAYCGGPFEHVDHVIPLSKGGSNWPANLRPACKKCNLSKRAKRLKEWLAGK